MKPRKWQDSAWASENFTISIPQHVGFRHACCRSGFLVGNMVYGSCSALYLTSLVIGWTDFKLSLALNLKFWEKEFYLQKNLAIEKDLGIFCSEQLLCNPIYFFLAVLVLSPSAFPQHPFRRHSELGSPCLVFPW